MMEWEGMMDFVDRGGFIRVDNIIPSYLGLIHTPLIIGDIYHFTTLIFIYQEMEIVSMLPI